MLERNDEEHGPLKPEHMVIHKQQGKEPVRKGRKIDQVKKDIVEAVLEGATGWTRKGGFTRKQINSGKRFVSGRT